MSSARTRILVFIPTYRCERQIGRTLSQFSEPDVARRFDEILVLDNRSTDGTLDAAMARARELNLGKVTLARNFANYGLGGSHKAAFSYALENGFSHLVVLHGDDQGSIKDIVDVLDARSHEHYHCCLGARFHPQAQLVGYSRLRIAGNHVFNALFSLISRRRLHDLGSGLNIYATQHLQDRYWWKFREDLTFNYCMILAHVAREEAIMFFPISWREDDQVSNVKLLSQAGRTLALLLRFAIGRHRFVGYDFRTDVREAFSFEIIARSV